MESPSAPIRKEFEFTREDFDYLRKVVSDATGIVSSEDKYTMYYSRLAARLRALGLADFRAYRDYLGKNTETESIELINSVTTNLTSFFRENHHFDYLRDNVIPQKRQNGERRLRIWSAGCSSGEEAYSIAITLQQAITDLNHWDIRILATDIDSQVLTAAREGIYDPARIVNLDELVLKRFFAPVANDTRGRVRVDDSLRRMIQFQQLNLLHRWPMREKFDLIFCRNVIIYFGAETKVELVDRFADQLVGDGLLMMGHSESLYRTSERFELLGKTVYRLAATEDKG
ncbi:MAG: protein-glutamate O-methyltransferase CheR [Gammaproteobacteria bacterium]|nr:protein-glutamate O-methyltransferase CheR [Gammaproteobacteria bacterium]